jgi:endonuclease/exonuclease/phosphatase family metal-dependent hydrolase
MHHGRVAPHIAQGLIELRRRIDAARIPASVLDQTVNIATWNIREFGRRRRKPASIHYIAEILNEFDLIAITELRDNLTDLKRVMDILGPYWDVVVSDFIKDRKGNRERLGFLFDSRSVIFTGLAAEADPPRLRRGRRADIEDDWWRRPYMASFRAGNFDFVLLAAHIRWGAAEEDRIPPLRRLAKWVDQRRKQRFAVDKDIIVMGDFNIPKVANDRLFDAISSTGLKIPPALRDVVRTNIAASAKRYDQILHYPTDEARFPATGAGGTLDFNAGDWKELYPDPGHRPAQARYTYELSDHLPLWVQVQTDIMDKRLQILSGLPQPAG